VIDAPGARPSFCASALVRDRVSLSWAVVALSTSSVLGRSVASSEATTDALAWDSAGFFRMEVSR